MSLPTQPTNLRDWFAGQALNGILSNLRLLKTLLENTEPDKPSSWVFAENAYAIADSMLAIRQSQNESIDELTDLVLAAMDDPPRQPKDAGNWEERARRAVG